MSQYLDPRWQKKRLEILSRDNFACTQCGTTEKTLHVHHTVYRNEAEGPWDYLDSSLITLCDDCHKAEHDELWPSKKHFLGIVAEAGFGTCRGLDELSAFLDNVRCGCRNKKDRERAIDYLLEYWEKNGAYSEGEAA